MHDEMVYGNTTIRKHIRYLSHFVFNLSAGSLFETFFVSAVSSMLSIRAFLALTGYPQIGGGRFHIAHMLWGGLLLGAAVGISLIFLNKEARKLSAIVGGIGFGTFIDELGKFITHDNNYFYEPTIAIIYVGFVVMLLTARASEKRIHVSTRDYVVNALEVVKEVVLNDLDREEKDRALRYLSRGKSSDPVVRIMKNMLHEIETLDVPEETTLVMRMKHIWDDWYGRLVTNSLFLHAVVGGFIVYSLRSVWLSLSYTATSGFVGTFWQSGHIVSSFIGSSLVVFGIVSFIRGKRLSAYRYFKRSILIAILLTQVFAFYHHQLSALVGLFVSIVILAVIQQLIYQEERLEKI